MHKKTNEAVRALLACLAVCLGCSAVYAADPAPRDFRIEPQSVSQALKAFAAQADMQLIFTEKDAGGAKSAGVTGTKSAREALQEILKGTGLEFEFTANNVVVVRKASAAALTTKSSDPPGDDAKNPSKEGKSDSSSWSRGGQADQGSAGAQAVEDKKEEKVRLEEIVVTGTHLRAANPISPIISETSEQLYASGYSRLDQYLAQMPQNFSGGGASVLSNSGSVGSNASGSSNYSFASGVNLRGLGSDSTLILLNGNRLPATAYGTSTDISRIPLAAIDRVDVLTDGASATYGSDAVAGVVNIKTRRDFSGIEVDAQAGTISRGKSPDYIGDLIAGTQWADGGVIAAFDYDKQKPLLASSRSYSSNLLNPSTLLPSTETSTGYIALHQNIASDLTFSLDSLFGHRNFLANYNNFGTVVDYVSGSSVEYTVQTKIIYLLRNDLRVSLDGTVSDARDAENSTFMGFLSGANLRYPTKSLELSGDGKVMTLLAGDTRLAIGIIARQDGFKDSGTSALPVDVDRTIWSAYGELLIPIVNSTMNVPLVEHISIDVSGRYDHYSDVGSTANPKIAAEWSPVTGLTLRATYGTSFRAPTLDQLYGTTNNYGYVFDLPDLSSAAGVRRSLILDNTANPSLEPEKSKAFTVGLALEPASVPGLKLNVSYFDIDFTNRIERLSDLGLLGIVQDASQYGRFVNLNPALDQVNAALATPGITILDLNNPPGYTPSQIKAIANVGLVNAAVSHPRGMDADGAYHTDTSIGQLRAHISGSYFVRYPTQFTPEATPLQGYNSVADPTRFRGQAELGWRNKGWSSYLRVNYENSYRNQYDLSCGGSDCPVASFMTLDLGAAYSVHIKAASIDNLQISLDAVNLTDRSPPYVGVIAGNFDGVNASPLGRAFTLRVSSHW